MSGKASVHFSSDEFMAAFKVRFMISTFPFACGWYGVVLICLQPSNLVNSTKMLDVNCRPKSVVILAGVPKRLIHPSMKDVATDLAVMSGMGTASGQFVKRSTIIKQYFCSFDGGNGPTMSMFMSVNRLVQSGKRTNGVRVCLFILDC